MKKYLGYSFSLGTGIAGVFLVFGLLLAGVAQAANSSLTATETVANVAVGTNDQVATLATSTANVTQVKASTTLTVVAVPAAAETITIGACVVTFQVAASSTAALNCTTNAMNIDIGAGVNATTTTGLAATLRLLTNVHNATASSTNLTPSAASTSASVVFTTASGSTETGGRIKFVDGTSGDITTAASNPGVAPVAEIDHVTIGGTVEAGDVFGIVTSSTTYSYTVLAGLTTNQQIANALYNAVWAAAGSSTEGFTVSTTTNKVVLTATAAGTGVTATTTVTNYSGVAQQVTFTPGSVTAEDVFTITLDGSNYSYTARSGDVASTTSVGLVSALASNPTADCVQSLDTVVCSAKVAGTSFTYSASVSAAASTGGGGGSGAGAGAPGPVVPALRVTLPLPALTNMSPVAKAQLLAKTLRPGDSGKQVVILQDKLKKLGFLKASVKSNGYFGLQTKAALVAFEKAYKIKPAVGMTNVTVRKWLNSLAP